MVEYNVKKVYFEISCVLCKNTVLHNAEFPFTQEEKNGFICSECESIGSEYSD